jgi:hypothetical protein
MKIYAPNYKEEVGEHKQHFNYDSMIALLKGCFCVDTYRTFEFGFNQIFVCRKI